MGMAVERSGREILSDVVEHVRKAMLDERDKYETWSGHGNVPMRVYAADGGDGKVLFWGADAECYAWIEAHCVKAGLQAYHEFMARSE